MTLENPRVIHSELRKMTLKRQIISTEYILKFSWDKCGFQYNNYKFDAKITYSFYEEA